MITLGTLPSSEPLLTRGPHRRPSVLCRHLMSSMAPKCPSGPSYSTLPFPIFHPNPPLVAHIIWWPIPVASHFGAAAPTTLLSSVSIPCTLGPLAGCSLYPETCLFQEHGSTCGTAPRGASLSLSEEHCHIFLGTQATRLWGFDCLVPGRFM